MMRAERSLLVFTLASILVLPLHAAGQQDEDEVRKLDRVVVVANKVERPLREVAGIVDVLDAEDIDLRLIRDISDLLKYEPGITMNREPGRFANSGYSIRGVGGNRVVTEIDGVPVGDGFAIGDFSNAGRDLVDPEILKRVEILRGPASALYGSDALGGVIAYTTLDPRDLAKDDNYFAIKAGYGSADASWHTSAYYAGQGASVDALALVSVHEGNELEAVGTDANPAEYRNTGALIKLVRYSDAGEAMRLTVDVDDGQRETRVLSLVNGPGRYATTTRMEGDDDSRRVRASLSGEWNAENRLADDAVWRVFYQDAEFEQFTLQELAADTRTPYPTRRERRFLFSQEVIGGEFTAEKTLTTALDQQLVYGIEVTNTTTDELREGVLTNLSSGGTSNTIIGEVFPLRDFPVSDTLEAGIYVQDEIAFGGGNWMLIPALRYEYYKLDPKEDAIYAADNPGTTPVSISETQTTPRLALIRQFGADDSLYLQYARGFRAPPFEDANIGLDIPLFGYRAIPNPELEPETSNSIELGWRHDDGVFSWETGLFYTKLDDLIESRAPLGVDPVSGLLLFQSVNREKARIHGAELRMQWLAGESFDALEGWRFDAAASIARGVDTERDEWLNSVDPDSAIFGAHYEAASSKWTIDAYWTVTAAKQQVDETAGDLYQPAGYGVLDMFAGWKPGAGWELRAGIENITDKQYWRWADVRGLTDGDPLVPLHAQPGRSIRLSVKKLF